MINEIHKRRWPGHQCIVGALKRAGLSDAEASVIMMKHGEAFGMRRAIRLVDRRERDEAIIAVITASAEAERFVPK
jgi:hypothetical protein